MANNISPSKRPHITILTPVYNEEGNLKSYYKEVQERLLTENNFSFSILFIDDGSTDNSWQLISDICDNDPACKAIRLSRNFGSHVALSAGFDNAKGDAIATLACDLQDPPETILEFAGKWQEGAQIIWGKRRSRDDANWRIFTSNLFQKLLSRFAMPQGSRFTTGSFFLVDEKVAQCFKQFSESNRITFALVAWTGFEQEVVEYDRKKRLSGVSKWNFGKMIKAMYDAFIGFSFLPIRLMTFLGITVSMLAFLSGIYLVALWIIGNPPSGWSSIMFAVTLFFGFQFLLMGIVGEYLYRIYSEVVRRPLYFISADKETVPDQDDKPQQ